MSRPRARSSAAPAAVGKPSAPPCLPAGRPRLDLSKIRHDLRTPINHILGYCEMLQEDEHTPAAFQADLRRIHAGGRQLLALLTQYFDEEIFESRRHDLFQLCHELRTPVNHIIGYGEILQEQAEDLGQQCLLPDLRKITDAARRWLGLMEEYLVLPSAAAVPAPAPAPELPTPGLAGAAPGPTTPATPAPAPRRLLVVDDDGANRDMLARRLQRQGFQVATAAGGSEALQALRAQPADLVLLDLVMPSLDGFQVLTRMKADPALAAVPVIMVSALDQVAGIARCIEAGAEDYLPKPFEPVLLRARVNAALEKKRLREAERTYLQQLEEERARSERLLLNILPRPIAERLKRGETTIVDSLPEATVLFADLVGFTALAAAIPSTDLVRMLDGIFSEFDRLAETQGLEKIKTIGDAYMLVGGLPAPRPDHAEAVAEVALGMAGYIERTFAHLTPPLRIRIGLHLGPVIAGVIGRRKFTYDLWGDTVNLASRMESLGLPGRIQVTEAAHERLKARYTFQKRGELEVKGKGRLPAWFLTGRRAGATPG